MKTAKVRSRPKLLFGFTHNQIVEALKVHIARAGHPVLDVEGGKAYVVGLERQGAEADDTVLTLVVEEMPNFMKPCNTPVSATVYQGKLSERAELGSQKFEFTHKGVSSAMVAFCVRKTGKPFPDGRISLWGLDERGGHNSCGHQQRALTLHIDPS